MATSEVNYFNGGGDTTADHGYIDIDGTASKVYTINTDLSSIEEIVLFTDASYSTYQLYTGTHWRASASTVCDWGSGASNNVGSAGQASLNTNGERYGTIVSVPTDGSFQYKAPNSTTWANGRIFWQAFKTEAVAKS